MKHFTSEELLEAAEGRLAPDRTAHEAECGGCRARVADISRIYSELRHVDVPEPSPLFWEHFSDRVRRAIDVETVADSNPWWLPRARVRLAAGAAIAVLVIGIFARGIRAPEPDNRGSGVAPVVSSNTPSVAPAGPGGDDEAGWELIVDVASDVEWTDLDRSDLPLAPGAADRAMANLTEDERRELERLLKTELDSKL